MKIIFINYGPFGSNSGAHIAHFANGLASRGHSVAVCASGPPGTLSDYGPTLFEPIDVAELEASPSQVACFDGKPAKPLDTIVHCWTPRERVRQLAQPLIREVHCPYVVHLEDNEEVIAAAQLQTSWKDLKAKDPELLDIMIRRTLSHPLRYPDFIARSAGATLIVDTLREFVPQHISTHILEPGVDTRKFAPSCDPTDRQALLAELGVDTTAKVIVYHGAMHAANQREIFSLYTAVAILQRRGLNVALLRASVDYTSGLDVSYSHLTKHVLNLGFLQDDKLLRVLKSADAYVQPGAADEFNIYRLPSKLPEFLALGKPVLLPLANIGRQLTDGVEAILLRKGDGTEIADRLQEVFADGDLARALGRNGRKFAGSHLNWEQKVAGLEGFYESITSRRL